MQQHCDYTKYTNQTFWTAGYITYCHEKQLFLSIMTLGLQVGCSGQGPMSNVKERTAFVCHTSQCDELI